jgi:hydrogenase expression/formation protein HypE
MGKLATKDLQKMLDCIKPDERVLVPPMLGYDAGVHRLGDQYVAVAADPCTGVPEEWFGWLLINYAASDVALFGAKPQFCTVSLLGPKPTAPERFQKVMAQTCKAADELDIAIVRGHTGMYDSLKELLGVCTVYGTVKPELLRTPKNAKAGDLILCTKPLGLETLTNFSLAHAELANRLFGVKKQRELAELVSLQSCVKEALELSEVDGVHSMHDATEGGFVAALNELAGASGLGLRVDWQRLPISPEVATLQNHFKLSDTQVLSLSSTGTILAAVAPQAQKTVTEVLSKLGLSASFIGEFTKSQKRVLIKEGGEKVFPSHFDDPYTMLLSAVTS